MLNFAISQILKLMGSLNDDNSAISHLVQNSPEALCEKCAIADFDVRNWLLRNLEPKYAASRIEGTNLAHVNQKGILRLVVSR